MGYLNKIGCFLLVLIFVGCGNNDDGLARLQVELIDAPGDYEKVNIDILDVQVNAGTDESGFTSLADVNSGVFNLLDLVNDLKAVLADVEIPAGRISQIRLILGDKNTLVIDGEPIDLTIPSGSQSGLKLNLQMELLDGITYKILLDFDAAKSVVKAGNSGKYNLKPSYPFNC
ncbi:MAG: DUF4382 domain-containing protein [Bacteroidetes bacterium]|nr:DUF4382 domain-containing protein [Bacteroidota bacterium]MDA1120091.1 DUF4382 domain-containing protein [Bacteroidota bacterium]